MSDIKETINGAPTGAEPGDVTSNVAAGAGAFMTAQARGGTDAVPPTQAPNSKPRDPEPSPIETYVYRDFANAEPSSLGVTGCLGDGRMPPQSLQSQKLPSKLNAMLSDPDLTSIITWMPHGRSWKILNREMFSSFALPRYFGHSNHASFVRIVNAWGFRRISIGVDRDSYYHELFLRGKPGLHQRMKRLPSCHRKTPVDKEDRCPDFYDLAKSSPLPEVTWNNSLGQTAGQMPGMITAAAASSSSTAFPPQINNPNMTNNGSYNSMKPIHFGDAAGAFSSNGIMGGAGGMAGNPSSSFGMADNSMFNLFHMNSNINSTGDISSGGSFAPQASTDAFTLNTYTQNLQRENENLMLKIKLLEYENQAKQQQPQQQQQYQAMGNNSQPIVNLAGNDATGDGSGFGLNFNMGAGIKTEDASKPSSNPPAANFDM